MELLENLRKIVNRKISLCSIEDLKKYKMIKELLEEDDCFFRMKKDTAYAILEDLDFLKKELPSLYRQLTDASVYLKTKCSFEIEG